MISWLHLLWILPITLIAGYTVAALMFTASHADDMNDWMRENDKKYEQPAYSPPSNWCGEQPLTDEETGA